MVGGTGSTISKCQVQLNFKVTGNSSYSDPEGKERDSFVCDSLAGAIAFKEHSAFHPSHGLITATPAASKGPVSRVATVRPLAQAMAAM